MEKNSKKDGIFFIPRLDFPAMKKLTANFSYLLVIGKPWAMRKKSLARYYYIVAARFPEIVVLPPQNSNT